MSSGSFDQLRRQCLKDGTLYEDADFQCIQQSVFYDETPPFKFVWKRPHEITCDPKFICPPGHKSPLPFETIVGKLGDPWFVSAISLLYQSKGLFYRVVPADQSFESHEYAGIFRFRIWWFGQWQEVIVDDRLPINPVTNRPIFIQPLYSTVFWPALLEKAFAKLHGSYEALKYGSSAELLADLTGGATEIFDLTSDSLSDRSLIQQLISMSSIVTAVVSHDYNDDTHNRSPLSLSQLPPHARDDHQDVDQRDAIFNHRNNSSPPAHFKHKFNRQLYQTAPATAPADRRDFARHETNEMDENEKRHPSAVRNEMSANRSYFYPAPHYSSKMMNHHSTGKLAINSCNRSKKSSSSCSSSEGESGQSSPGVKCHRTLHTDDHPIGVTDRRSCSTIAAADASRDYIVSNANGHLSSSSCSPSNSCDNVRQSIPSSDAFYRLPCGLISSINYQITAVEKVEIISGLDGSGMSMKEYIYLVRLVNPMANWSKYTGTFGSKSDHRWSRVSSRDRVKVNSIDEECDLIDDIDDINHENHRNQHASQWQAKNSKNNVNGSNNCSSSRFNQSNIVYDRNRSNLFMSSPSTMSNNSSSSSSSSSTCSSSCSAFWMEWSDFAKYFTHLEVVYLDGETSRDEPSLRSKFAMTVKLFRGIWRKGVTAGGCRNNQDTFHLNPQIEVTINPEAEDLLVICLNQHAVLEPQVVGFSMYKLSNNNTSHVNNNNVDNNNSKEKNECTSSPINSSSSTSSQSSDVTGGKMDRNFFRKSKSLINSAYCNSRQVVLRCALNRGTYLLMPTSFECGHEGLFSIRIYSMKGIRLRILDSPNCMSKSAIIKSPASFDVKFVQYEMMFMHLADENNTVNAFELTDLLISSLPNDYVKSCATLDVARMIVTAFDSNGFGRIHIKNYKSIMCSLRYWQNIFKNHTKGTTGILRVEKLEDALHDIGFTLSTEIASRLILKYMRKDSTLRFGDFVSAVLQLTIAFTSYDKYMQSNNGKLMYANDEASSSLPSPHASCISPSFSTVSPVPSTIFSLTDWLRVSLQT